MKKLILAINLIFVIFILTAQAGIVVKSMEKSDQMDGNMGTTMYVDHDNLRMEVSDTENDQIIIFRSDKNVFWMINNEDQTYVEMTQKDLEQLKAQMDNMQKMMAEQLKNMPEEQRKMMEQMMPSTAGSTKKVKTTYEKKASGEKVGKWICDRYEGFQNGKKSGELWTASWEQLGINRTDMSVFKKMAEFFEVISQDANEFMKIGSEEWEKELGISGVPVRWIDYMDGEHNSQGEITEVTKKEINPSLFELPAGYEKEDNPWKNQGAGMDRY